MPSSANLYSPHCIWRRKFSPIRHYWRNIRMFPDYWDEPDYVTNIRLIEHLLGKSTIYMLHDSTYIDRHIKATLHEQCAQVDIRVDNNRIMYIPVEIATLDRVNQSLKRPDSTTVNVVPVQGDKLSAVSWYMSKHVPYIYYLQAKRDYRVLNTSRFPVNPLLRRSTRT